MSAAMATKITKVYARQVLDSRGNPTVEADVHVGAGARARARAGQGGGAGAGNGVRGRATVPSGASTGDRKSTRLNSSHGYISYAAFCLKKNKSASRSLATRLSLLSSQTHSLITENHLVGSLHRTLRTPLACRRIPSLT